MSRRSPRAAGYGYRRREVRQNDGFIIERERGHRRAAKTEYSRRGEFPVNLVAEIKNVFDSTGVRGMPA